MSNLGKSIFYAMSSRYVSLIIQLISITVVARLLTPEEIGIYSISASLFGFLLLIRDFGIGSYLIQEKNLTNDKILSAFSMSLMLCWSLAMLVFVIRHQLSAFYELPQMTEIMGLLAINLVLIPFGAITLSLLKRNMQFNKVMMVDVSSAAVGTGTTILMALNDMSYLSLAYGSLAGTATTVIVASFFRPNKLPYLPRITGIKRVASFGWKISGSNVFEQIGTSSPDLILGKIQGPIEAGFFNKTVSIFKLFNQLFLNAIRPVYQSYMAQKNRENQGVKEPVLLANNYYLILSWAFLAFILFHAKGLIHILFGDQWHGIVPLVKVYCISHALNSIFIFHQTTLTSLGKAGKVLKLTITLAIAQFLVILAYGQFDLIYIFAALISIPLIRFIVIRRDLVNLIGITAKDLVFLCKLPSIIFVVLFAVNFLLDQIISDSLHFVIEFLLAGFVSLFFFLTVIMMSQHPWRRNILDFSKFVYQKTKKQRYKE